MRVLVVGSGGREHTLVAAFARSPRVDEVLAAPGNAGMAEQATCVDVGAGDLSTMVRLARERDVDLTVVGPEEPLAAGIVDTFRDAGLRIFGPTQAAARLESSKAFAKEFMRRHGIPTAQARICDTPAEARAALEAFGAPVVVKASGLAAGKGVTVCQDLEAAFRAIEGIMEERRFGAAGERVVIEECLQGEELSILAVTDGTSYRLLAPAQDHKRIGEGDTGANTGGMGAYSPVPIYNASVRQAVNERIIGPAIEGMAAEGSPYQGVLYAGLMLTEDGPQVLEFNARFGDPEAQVVLPRLQTDLVELIEATLSGTVDDLELTWTEEHAACVIMASGGYPQEYTTGFPIQGLAEAASREGVELFHAGTALQNGKVVTAGGRVLGVTALGPALEQALERCYEAIAGIEFSGACWRTDIGHRALSQSSFR